MMMMMMMHSKSLLLRLGIVVAVVVMQVSSSKVFHEIRDELDILRNDAPLKLFDESIELQASMLRSLDHFNNYKSYFVPSRGASKDANSKDNFGGNGSRDRSPNNRDDDLIVDIHTDVVFVGFPASSLEVVRDKWFESLGRTDDTLATIGLRSESTISIPGGSGTRHHFHLVQVSFHVADALKARMEKIMRPSTATNKAGEADEYYFNSWEVDELLQSLSDVISATHTKGGDKENILSVRPAATIYVLNLDVGKGKAAGGELPSYTYRNGFSDDDVRLLAKDESVLQLCRQTVDLDKRASRLDFDSARGSPSLRRSQRSDSEYPQEDAGSSSNGRDLVHWRDAVKETRQWAGGVGDETGRLESSGHFSLQERAKRILSSSEKTSAIMKDYKFDLARGIIKAAVSSQPVLSDEANGCSSETWFGAGRVVWTDLHATRNPPYYFEYGNSLNAPAPRKLTDSEWLRLGDGAVKSMEGAAESIDRTRQSIQRHKAALQSLISQSKCPSSIINVARGVSRSGPTDSTVDAFLANIGEELLLQVKELKNAAAARSCAHMQLQQVLLDVLASSSVALSTIAQAEAASAQQRIDNDFSHFFRDQALLHSELLELALTSSDAMHEHLSLNISRVSEEAAVYLGHLSASVLRLSRFMLAPPLSLHANPIATPSDITVFGGLSTPHPEGGTSTPTLTIGKASDEQSLLELVHVWRSVHDEADATPLRVRKGALASWLSLLPPSLVPSRIEVVVYAIKLQSSYAPLASFDYWSFLKEVPRLRLPNQQMTLTLHEVDASGEIALGLGLKACRRSELVTPADDFSRRSATFKAEYTVYLDSLCIWSYLQHHDEEGELRPELKGHTSHLPIFLISLDTPEPTYLDGLHLAVNVGNAVLVVQNRQEAIRSQLMCGHRQLYMNGRNPLSPALAAVARALTGATMRHTGHCGRASAAGLPVDLTGNTLSTSDSGSDNKADGKGQDWSLGLGSSPLFQAPSFATPHFSQAEVEVVQRSRLHRSLSISREIATLYDVHAAEGNSSVPLGDKMDWLTLHALRALQGADYATAASLSNELYLLTLAHLPSRESLSDDLIEPEKKNSKKNTKKFSSKMRERTRRKAGLLQLLCNYVIFPLLAFAMTFLLSQQLSRCALAYSRRSARRAGSAYSSQGFRLG